MATEVETSFLDSLLKHNYANVLIMREWIKRNRLIMPVLFIGIFPIFLEEDKGSGMSVMAVIFGLLVFLRLFADYWFFIRKQD